MNDPGRPDRAIAEIAARQHGVVARRQLLALGLGRGAIQHRLDRGRLHLIHREVYAVGHRALAVRGRWMAAVLAGGEGALLSHRSAAALWGLASAGGARVDVTVARRSGGSRPGIRLHRVRRLHPDETTTRERIPLTSVARTLIDLAEVVDPAGLRRAFEAAERQRLLDLGAVEQVCGRARGRKALKPVLAVLPSLRPAPETRSELERRFFDFCVEFDLPRPSVKATVEGLEVDAVWPDRQLVVELDGYEFHRTRGAFERDRARDASLQAARYRIVRLTHRRLTEEPEKAAGVIRRLLA